MRRSGRGDDGNTRMEVRLLMMMHRILVHVVVVVLGLLLYVWCTIRLHAPGWAKRLEVLLLLLRLLLLVLHHRLLSLLLYYSTPIIRNIPGGREIGGGVRRRLSLLPYGHRTGGYIWQRAATPTRSSM